MKNNKLMRYIEHNNDVYKVTESFYKTIQKKAKDFNLEAGFLENADEVGFYNWLVPKLQNFTKVCRIDFHFNI